MHPTALSLIAAAAAVGIGIAMIPQPLEQVTMLMRDKQFERALHLADTYVAAGEKRPELLLQAFLLNERYGDLMRAEHALRGYLAARPDDAAGWRKAVWFYQNAHRSEPLADALENVVRLTGDPEDAHRLARLYRLNARFDDELRVLETIAPGALDAEHGLRLASLLIARDRLTDARAVLVRLDETVDIKMPQPRLALFDVLLQRGEFDEAVRRAEVWLAAWRTADGRASLVRQLLRAGAEDAALRLASGADESVEPQVLAYLLETLSREDRLSMLRDLIARWVEHAGRLPLEGVDVHLREVAAVAKERGLDTDLVQYLVQALERDDRPDLLGSLVEALYEHIGHAAVMPFRAALTPEFLATRPVFAARLLLAEGNPLAARHFLLEVGQTELSGPPARGWLIAARDLLSPTELLYELSARARCGGLAPELLHAALELAVHLGREAEVRHLRTVLEFKPSRPGTT